jgi:hypothetical protein
LRVVAEAEQAPDGRVQQRHRHGLRQHLEETARAQRVELFDRRAGGDREGRRVAQPAQRLQAGQAVAVGQVRVDQPQRMPRRACAFERLRDVAGDVDLRGQGSERFRQEGGAGGIVFDQQQVDRVHRWSPG